jgi:hypothetical protein
MHWRHYRTGDWVVYGERRFTTCPSRQAHDIDASENGDFYSYTIDKHWVVAEVRTDGKLLLRTKRGTSHVIDASDLKLRHATLWERIRYRNRFTEIVRVAPDA